MSLLISTAHAAQGAQQGSPYMSLIMIVVMIAIFYFLLIRPQSKRMKEHRALVEGLSEGSEVVFAGGLMGRIVRIDGEYAVIELNPSNQVKIQRASVISVLPEGTLNNL
ncbi:protein translocase subunit yajC [Acinetobacter marinus]|uniref:Sec translocon accessory complex subunit YajC n=1 Tax=Acinetobacter marinus TaxID=281375 RepID=A0A1G6N8L6_9GAMM|nr:preprotein translocase subunit YajC [Acinetobacter marinus]SDC63764.1 protein translocase subunit yajC [Acinetobacter marinus]